MKAAEGMSARETLALNTDVVLKATTGHQRRYTATFSRPGGVMGELEVDSRLRGKAVAIVMFRKWFGSGPNQIGEHWGTAWAEDRRGNLVTVDQVNNFSLWPVRRGLLLPEKCEAA